jgi:hypothetical protein
VTTAASKQETQVPTPSDLFAGRYRIEAQLGRGTFGTVYRAFDTRLKRPVALKLPHRLLAADPEFLRTFMREAQVAAALNHPNVVTIYDVGETEEGLPYLAMRFLQGRPLRQVLLEGPLPLERGLAILDQLAAALDYLQSQQLVHRDIKPANIMVDAAGLTTLMDFGLARSIQGTHLTLTGALAFTPLYASPEQVTGERLTPASDRYCFAVVAYETLTGQAPHASYDSQVLLHAIRFEAPTPPEAINQTLPPAVGQVLLAALAKQPDERPTSTVGLMRDLRAALSQSAPRPRRRTPQHVAAAVDAAVARGGNQRAAPVSPIETIVQPEAYLDTHEQREAGTTGGRLLPTRMPRELTRYAEAGIERVEIFGRGDQVCPACAAARVRSYALDTAPQLPLSGCTSLWGCHCEYAPLPEEEQILPSDLYGLLNPGQRSRLELLELRYACLRGEGEQIEIVTEPEACRVCQTAAHPYNPDDVPTLPLYNCRRYPPCESHYQLLSVPEPSPTLIDAIRDLDARLKRKGWPWKWRT